MRKNCIYATLGVCYSVWMTVWYAVWNENTLRNKHTKKNCAPSWLYLQDYTGMHGQQNILKNMSVVYQVFLEQGWRTCGKQ